ncbi:MAG: hypothetical protein HKM06_08835, partial [Spirochaetales bacterium]|nr:hypothetical protein [Spirochaetales bacterium]
TFTGWKDSSGTAYTVGSTQTMGPSSVTLTAQWSANTYTISFDPSGGSGSMAAQSAAMDSSVTLSANAFTKAGYYFSGWATTPGATTYSYANAATFTMGAGNLTLYAVWSANTINVSFDNPASVYAGNGSVYAANTLTQNGNTVPDPSLQSAVYGSTITLPASPYVVPAGYTFGGWTDGTTVYQPSTSYTVPSGNVTLHAVWIPIAYTLTYNGLTNFTPTIVPPSTVVTGHIGQTITLYNPPSPETANYETMVGWQINGGGQIIGLGSNMQFTFGSTTTTLSTTATAFAPPSSPPNSSTQLAR